METGNVTPIQNSIRDAVAEISAENQRLHRENHRLRAELDMAAKLLAAADTALHEQPGASDAGA